MKRFIGRIQDNLLFGNVDPGRYQQCRVLWRGYLANGEEVLKEAKQRRIPLEDGSEGELFALAYRWWGDAMQSHLLGEYAVAVFDELTSSLLLTHDALGLLPMFYCPLPDGVLFGSHLEDLVQETGGGDLDEEFIADFIAICAYSLTRTPYRSIKRLALGHSLIYHDGKIVTCRSWDLPATGPLMAANEEYEELFLSLLDRGVKAALQADGPVWSELSGGLDSSTVVSMAVRSGTTNLEAISRVYERYKGADESVWIRMVLDRYPVPWRQLDGDHLLPYSELPDRFLGEPGLPMIDWSVHRRYEEMAGEHGVAAVLTGQGGDVVFFGVCSEPYYLADLARTLKWGLLVSELARWRLADPRKRSGLHWLVNYVFRPLASRWRGRPPRPPWRPQASPWIHPEYARKMALEERGRLNSANNYGTVEQCYFMEMLSTLLEHVTLLNQTPQAFAYRHPLFFRPLVEFMFSLPWNQKFNPDSDRFLQRRALVGILPERVRLKWGKIANDQICHEGLRQGMAWCDLLTDDPRVAARGIVDRRGWVEAVGRARMGMTHFLPQFEAVAMLEIWLRQLENLKRPGRPLQLISDPPTTGA